MNERGEGDYQPTDGELESQPEQASEKDGTVELPNNVDSFITAKGSVYQYDEEGRTTRYKTATQEQHRPQDLAVFLDLSLEHEQEILESLHSKDPNVKGKVYVIERQPDNSPKIIRKREDISNPAALYLGIFDEKMGMRWAHSASLEPAVGSNVFDTARHYDEDGNYIETERHLGNKVVDIRYRQE
ncbi:MAG: hypothetical protein WD896_00545 [Parcubacteria group bacterium]